MIPTVLLIMALLLLIGALKAKGTTRDVYCACAVGIMLAWFAAGGPGVFTK